MSLSDAAIYFKKFFKYFVIAVAGLATVWALVAGGLNIIPGLFNGGLKADYAFGVMPKPTIPTTITSKGISFVLDTIDGKLPNLPGLLAVYQTNPLSPDIMGPVRAAQQAASFQYREGPSVLDSQTYRYTSKDRPGQSITFNIGTQNFVLSTDYSLGNFGGPAPNSSTQDLTSKTKSFFTTRSLLPDEMSNANATVTYRAIRGNGSVQVGSIDSANFARIDLFRNNVNNYHIVGPIKDQGLVYIGVKDLSFSDRALLEVHYTFWAFSTDKKGIYPLVPVDQAFKQLQDGQASLISPNSVNFKTVNVKKIAIAYYQDDNYEPYLEPIYLFDGTGTSPDGSEVDARFYLPAVDAKYLK